MQTETLGRKQRPVFQTRSSESAKIYMEGLRQGPSVLVPYCSYNKSPKFIILGFWKSEVLKLRCWHNFVTSVGSQGKIHFLVFLASMRTLVTALGPPG